MPNEQLCDSRYYKFATWTFCINIFCHILLKIGCSKLVECINVWSMFPSLNVLPSGVYISLISTRTLGGRRKCEVGDCLSWFLLIVMLMKCNSMWQISSWTECCPHPIKFQRLLECFEGVSSIVLYSTFLVYIQQKNIQGQVHPVGLSKSRKVKDRN